VNNSFLINTNSTMDAMITERVVGIDIFNMGIIIIITTIVLLIIFLVIKQYINSN